MSEGNASSQDTEERQLGIARNAILEGKTIYICFLISQPLGVIKYDVRWVRCNDPRKVSIKTKLPDVKWSKLPKARN